MATSLKRAKLILGQNAKLVRTSKNSNWDIYTNPQGETAGIWINKKIDPIQATPAQQSKA